MLRSSLGLLEKYAEENLVRRPRTLLPLRGALQDAAPMAPRTHAHAQAMSRESKEEDIFDSADNVLHMRDLVGQEFDGVGVPV